MLAKPGMRRVHVLVRSMVMNAVIAWAMAAYMSPARAQTNTTNRGAQPRKPNSKPVEPPTPGTSSNHPMARRQTSHSVPRGLSERRVAPESPDMARPALSPLDLRYPTQLEALPLDDLVARSLLDHVPWLTADPTRDALEPAPLVDHAQTDRTRRSQAELAALRRIADTDRAALGNHPLVAATLHRMAAIHWANGDLDQTLVYLLDTEAVLERHIDGALLGLSEAERQVFMAMFYGDVDMAISLAIQTDDPRAKRLASTKLARRKGRIVDMMARELATLRAEAQTKEWTEEHGEAPERPGAALMNEYRAVLAEYASKLLYRPDDPSLAPEHGRITERLRARVRELERAIARTSGRSPGFDDPDIDIGTIQASLPHGSVLIEWTRYQPDVSEERTRYAASVLFEHGDPIWIDLADTDAVDQIVGAFHAALMRHDRAVSVFARQLDRLIMEPVRARLGSGCEDLWLSPDGALNLIPFAALLDEKGRYLVQRHALTYVTSGRDLLRMARATAAPRTASMVLADPDYGSAPEGQRELFAPLSGTSAEARMLRLRLPKATILTGKQASESRLMSVRGPRILHIATHGYFEPHTCQEMSSARPDTHLLAGLALAGANRCGDDRHDGLLNAAELSGLDLLGTRLAVLSACETGSGVTSMLDDFGRVIGLGEGVYGLRRALVLAGAQTQMISLWLVDDRATYEIMAMYYEKLVHGAGRSEALRATQLYYLREKPGLHPYYWASFIVSGDSRTLDGKRVPRGALCEERPAWWSARVGAETMTGVGADSDFLGVNIGVYTALVLARNLRLFMNAEIGIFSTPYTAQTRSRSAPSRNGIGRLAFGAQYAHPWITFTGAFDGWTEEARLAARVRAPRFGALQLSGAAGVDQAIRKRGGTRPWWYVGASLGLARRDDDEYSYVLNGRFGDYEHVGYSAGPALELSFARVMHDWRVYADMAWFPGPSPAGQSPAYRSGLVLGIEFTIDRHRSRFDTFADR